MFPLHVGMRQYWRDLQSLETWARSLPHQEWWEAFLKDSGRVGFWHETYFMRGGWKPFTTISKVPLGFSAFAPNQARPRAMFNARKRLGLPEIRRCHAPVRRRCCLSWRHS